MKKSENKVSLQTKNEETTSRDLKEMMAKGKGWSVKEKKETSLFINANKKTQADQDLKVLKTKTPKIVENITEVEVATQTIMSDTTSWMTMTDVTCSKYHEESNSVVMEVDGKLIRKTTKKVNILSKSPKKNSGKPK